MTGDLNDPHLYGRAELAERLGVKPWFIRRMLALGFQMPLGRASIAMAHRFIQEQADALTKTSPARKRRQPSTSGK
jgi:CO/xanthine dehydrogenase Mo-binding subunit